MVISVLFINAIIKNYFAIYQCNVRSRFVIDKYSLIYWEVDRDKIISECELSGMLLNDD